MTTSGGALASIAAASFCGNCEFSTTTYSTWVLLACPHACIWSPRVLSPAGVKDCQPQAVSFVPLDFEPVAAAGAVVAPAGAGGAAGAAVGWAAGCEHAAASSVPAPMPTHLRKSRRVCVYMPSSRA